MTEKGPLFIWSKDGSFYNLGHRVDTPQSMPRQVEALSGARVAAVATGCLHTLAVNEDGVEWALGLRSALGLGDPNPEDDAFAKTPTLIPTLRVRVRKSPDVLPFRPWVNPNP